MPGFNDTEAIAVYPTNPGDAFRVPTVERKTGFNVQMEAEAGNGVTGPNAVTPYSASIQIRNLTQFKLVTVTKTAPNAKGNIGVGESWATNDNRFIFEVGALSADLKAGDILEVLASLHTGNPAGDPSNDYSLVRSELFEVI
jgi:hypothetical protein